jgi:3-dehydroquinate dehydratase type I
MRKPSICASIINKDTEAVAAVEPLVDLFEVRIDLIGEGWGEVARQLQKPWIACNRIATEGGNWQDSEARRKEELLKAIQLGASIIDIELTTPNLGNFIPLIKKEAKCLLSFHDTEKTPPLDELKKIIKRQLAAGADICKVVTTATCAADNLTILRLIPQFPETKIIAFAMGSLGLSSRILCPLAGGFLTYASIEKGAESAPGQLTVEELSDLYRLVKQ